MIIKTFQFIQALFFCVIAGQAFFYLIGGTAGLKAVSAGAFIEQRKAIDVAIGPPLKLLYPGTVLVSLTMVVLLRQQVGSPLFWLSTLALFLIVTDLTLAIRGDIPLNKLIQTWSPTSYPANWSEVRHEWFAYMQWRQVCSIGGLLCVLAGLFWQLPVC